SRGIQIQSVKYAVFKVFDSKRIRSGFGRIVTELKNNDESQHIDAVYIPPAEDTLTDEKDMNDDRNLQEFEEPTDRVGTFESHVPEYTEVLDQSCTLLTTEPEWDSSDDETLQSKRKRRLFANNKLAFTVK
ncbi:hypothetical protein JTB14_010738, partial [Gonioctena quinquepunctata]